MYKLPDTLSEDIDRLAVMVDDYQAKKIESVQFKAFRVPMGIYEQRKNEVYMARIRTTGGVIFPRQLLEAIDIAIRHKSDLLHITTRQELQIQNLEINSLTPVLQELQQAGLATKGGGGNTVRNIIVSEFSEIAPVQQEVFDTTPYAMALTSKLIAESDSYLLPRKLKIAFSSDEKYIDCAAFNDLGFVAQVRDGIPGFRVYIGGGGGSRPSTGKLFADFIPASELFIVAEAVKKFFSEHGNRKNKHKARIRYIFYQLGNAETLALIREYYEKARLTTTVFSLTDSDEVLRPDFSYKTPYIQINNDYILWKQRYTVPQNQNGYYSILVPVLLGNIHLNDEKTVTGLKKLLHFIARFGDHTIRFTNSQSIRLRNIPEIALPELYVLLHEFVPDLDLPVLSNNIIACTGADTCRLGIGLSKGLASEIRKKLLNSDLDIDKLAGVKIHISGCPNSCGQHFRADIGFSGKILRNDRVYPGYHVWLAARRNETPHLAESVGDISAHDVPAFVCRLLKLYIDNAYYQLSLTEYLASDGLYEAKRLIDEYKNIPSFQEDKNYYYDWGADSVFSIVNRGAAECSAGLFDMIDVDFNNIISIRKKLETETDKRVINSLLYDMIFSSSRMLLVARGAEPKTTEDVFNLFISKFIDYGFVKDGFRDIVITARDCPDHNFSPLHDKISSLADAVIDLYKNMDDSLQFKNVAETKQTSTKTAPGKFKDLRGVICPMNFVQTKIQLSAMQAGDILEIWLDDGQPIMNVPGSVRNEGHEILEQTQTGDYWRVIIRKK